MFHLDLGQESLERGIKAANTARLWRLLAVPQHEAQVGSLGQFSIRVDPLLPSRHGP